jgi:hypothetical protein
LHFYPSILDQPEKKNPFGLKNPFEGKKNPFEGMNPFGQRGNGHKGGRGTFNPWVNLIKYLP